MKLESVRLLHALGVPDHYIANQVYQPIDEDHRQRGSFIILFEQANTTEGAFVASLINTLIREYYRQNQPDRLSCFEQTLVRMNEHIKEYLKSRDTGQPVFLNGTIVLFLNDEIHITYIGQPIAYLKRQNSLIELIETQNEAPTNQAPTFSVITSGEVMEDDTLVLVSSLIDPSHLEDDVAFVLLQTPLLESTRAYARLLKENDERATEATFIRFTSESDQTYQVYVDKALETPGEKVGEWQKNLARHTTSLAAMFTRKREDVALTKDESAVVDDTTDFLAEEIDTAEDTAPSVSEPPVTATDDEVPESADFTVKTYWQTEDTKPQPTSKPESVTSDFSIAETPITQLKSRLPLPKPRTRYMLIGALILGFILIRIFDVLPIGIPTTAKDTSARDALISQADTALREADAAQVQDDNETAIAALLTVRDLLHQIAPEEQTEQSKQLLASAEEKLTTLARITSLPETQLAKPLQDQAVRVISTPNGTFIFLQNGLVQKFTETDISEIPNLPEDLAIIDAVAYDGLKHVAFLTGRTGEDPKVYSLEAATGTMKELSRSDSKPWPASRLITSYVANLYFVGDTLFKATPRGEAYQVIDYAKDSPTDTITSLIIDNGFFYGLEDGKQLVRMDNKSPKTPIAYFGVPDSFIPQTSDRLIASRKQGTVYLFDRDGKRLLEFTTDGGYRKQYSLPPNDSYVDCDATDVGFVCATEGKEVKAFVLTP